MPTLYRGRTCKGETRLGSGKRSTGTPLSLLAHSYVVVLRSEAENYSRKRGAQLGLIPRPPCPRYAAPRV